MFIFTKRRTVAALLACMATASVMAEPVAKQSASFSYDYLQFSFVDLDDGYDGLKLDGSFSLNPELALITSYMGTDNSRNYDYDVFTLGLAYHQHASSMPKTDFVLHGEFERGSIEYVSRNRAREDDDTGLRFGAMLRHQAQKTLEVFGDISYSSLFDKDLALTGGVNLALNQQVSAVAAIELSDDDMLLFGARVRLK